MPLAATTVTEQSSRHWKGSLALEFSLGKHKTVLTKRRHRGPLTIQRAFYPEVGVCHIYLLHPPGGVVGGDELTIDVLAKAGSEALITTPGATKFYRSASDTAIQTQKLIIEDNASLEWLPQENIYFPGAHVQSILDIELQGNARAAVWDIQCFGRPSNGEAFNHGQLDSQWRLHRDGKPLLLERLRINETNRTQLSQLQQHPVCGTFVITHADSIETQTLQPQRLISDNEYLAFTQLDGLLVIRYLGNSTENARRYFSNFWQQIREPALGKKPIVPRIWNT